MAPPGVIQLVRMLRDDSSCLSHPRVQQSSWTRERFVIAELLSPVLLRSGQFVGSFGGVESSLEAEPKPNLRRLVPS